jgi:hypothetical protein
MSYNIYPIKEKESLNKAIKFIHLNNFSKETEIERVSKLFSANKIFGLMATYNNNDIVGVIFYYYQPNFKFDNKIYKVVNFSTMYVTKEHRGLLPFFLLKRTKKLFEDYIITDYTPIKNIEVMLLKLGFGYMKNYRKLVLPIPLINRKILSYGFGSLSEIEDKEVYKKIFLRFDQYRSYKINIWKFYRNGKTLLLGVANAAHERKIGFLKLKSYSKRIIWTDNEDLLAEEVNNISFLFFLKQKSHFITIDTGSYKKVYFSFNLKNGFMIYPDIPVKIPTEGSEFFSGIF